MTDNDKKPQETSKPDSEFSLGERIQLRRRQLDLNVEELALLTASFDLSAPDSDKGLSGQTLYRYEKGEREPGAREIRLLCGALNVSADWLIFGKLWNAEQAADSKLASGFRALVKEATDESIIRLIMGSNKSRDETHQLKLWEVKNRPKK